MVGEITELLKRAQMGDTAAESELLSRVYPTLKRLAAGKLRDWKSGGLQATELVNEAYLKIFNSETPVDWQNRAHFFAVVAQQVRFVLLDEARKRRSGDHVSVELDDSLRDKIASPVLVEITALNEALQGLESVDARAARVVVLRYFGGLTLEEVAEVLRLNISTIKRDWTFARSYLFNQLRPIGETNDSV
ncbi:MAG TPA: ECF-type sigma factor [Blastocatellia bacterium]|nr:ECF-type sigma factor [Blastocatellia bacterium]HMV87152.1 ECF-type sigma factor [Blastocatellia bacterium]HMX27695.1 ECF-type sigma factor [Blastocatellia bacterium]HMY73855.1 ECF-type sigma factor [Blastocatellia bacterium]HMZ22559.1 ECF-type sigma factor [Blastocatellia bacterium]